MQEHTATEALLAADKGPTVRDALVSSLARAIAKRERGNGHIGYESVHREAAEEYVGIVLNVLRESGP